MQFVHLNSGFDMPMVGLGLSHNGGFSKSAVLEALRSGTVLFDTAKRYGNEKEVGECILESGVLRENIFLTTKLWPWDLSSSTVRECCVQSLERLGVEYIDLYLVHWPKILNGGSENRIRVWKEMEKLVKEGLCRSIGVSNFLTHHLRDILENCEIVPAVNQIEVNPFQFPTELISFCEKHGIVVEGYCPFGKGELLRRTRWGDLSVQSLERKYEKSRAQILIRWALQNSVVAIPKSTKSDRIIENQNVFDFSISKPDMDVLNNLHENLRCTWDPTDVD